MRPISKDILFILDYYCFFFLLFTKAPVTPTVLFDLNSKKKSADGLKNIMKRMKSVYGIQVILSLLCFFPLSCLTIMTSRNNNLI